MTDTDQPGEMTTDEQRAEHEQINMLLVEALVDDDAGLGNIIEAHVGLLMFYLSFFVRELPKECLQRPGGQRSRDACEGQPVRRLP